MSTKAQLAARRSDRAWARGVKCDVGCKGWFRNVETCRIERCDTCARFDDDDGARDHAEATGDKLADIEGVLVCDGSYSFEQIEQILGTVAFVYGEPV